MLISLKLRSALLVTVLAASLPTVGADSTPRSGKEVAQLGNTRGATNCAACHGMDGAGQALAGYPRLAGLPERYIVKQLDAFADGSRESAIMERIAGSLSSDEKQQVASYYASLSYPEAAHDASRSPEPDVLEHGKRIALLGKWDQNAPACVRCHGENGNGVAPFFPPLAGQHAEYIEKELHRMKDGGRHNDPVGLMRAVAANLSDDDMHAVAVYFASLTPGKPQAAGAERAQRQGYEVADKSLLDRTLGKLDPNDGFHSPLESDMPTDEFGKAVLYGKQIFVDTQKYAGKYTGNGLNCVNCHLDRGRHNASAPMGPAYVRYPKYRSKNEKVNTIEERIQGCFRYSENGTPPPPLSDEMKALVSYFDWLATGAPANTNLKEAGFVKIDKPPQKPDAKRGAAVYARNCALCHGAEGDGTKVGDAYQFPPLWGQQSFNWGAGMHRINTAAEFIHANMPLGKTGSLSLQDAWDVAAYINSHGRPQDPRYEGDLQATKKKFHQHQCYYGETMWDQKLGAGK